MAIITYGVLVEQAIKASEMLLKKGIKTRVVRLLCVSPIPVAELKQELNGVRKAIVLEETTSASGIGQVLSGVLDGISVDPVNLGDGFVTHGSVTQLYSHCGLDAASVADKIMEVVRREN